ncbi:ABC-type iron transport system FetAB, ATPase component [Sulfurivirga caldicuralii]|uniref:ABC-type iron transport system FetAB, ATPase component n=1 Tax=Sulfurivirga caldicuralii TaxID=364032 RepID=A0A1N6DH09_9GAMM|nr:ABC transporter ATP-binding protein [Sulfurivirga caldicuralii]SIN70048.1 ABC-type iron transport system FetAB, ATPase component [Sulfurivirga caldicuralii]
MFRAEGVCNAGMRAPVDLALDSGEIVLVQGHSGSGKSRLLRALADLDPHEGDILLDDMSQQRWKPCDWRVAVMYFPAQPAWWRETAAQHFSSPPPNDWLAALALAPELLKKPIAMLSSGEQQRLALLRGLVRQPRILLLDEPTANLDDASARRVETLLQDYLAAAPGRGAVWISHNSAQAARLHAKRVIQLSA